MSDPSEEKVTITFLPSGQVCEVRKGVSLLKVIREQGLPIGYSCRGQGICIACFVWVSGATRPESAQEIALLERLGEGPNREGFSPRIACLVKVDSDMIVSADYW